MPIEIRELVIRATVDAGGSGGAAAAGCGPASPDGADSGSGSQAGGGDDLVQTCVTEVLRILADKRER